MVSMVVSIGINWSPMVADEGMAGFRIYAGSDTNNLPMVLEVIDGVVNPPQTQSGGMYTLLVEVPNDASGLWYTGKGVYIDGSETEYSPMVLFTNMPPRSARKLFINR